MELGAAPNCSGSSHVRIANTDVLVGIKVNYSRSRVSIGTLPVFFFVVWGRHSGVVVRVSDQSEPSAADNTTLMIHDR